MKKTRVPALNLIVFFCCCLWMFGSCGPHTDHTDASDNPSAHPMKNLAYSPVRIINGTFLGNQSRNYYGDSLPSALNEIWAVNLGRGQTIVSKEKGIEEWAGAGWTGQPLMMKENGTTFLIIGAYDHHLKKIRISDGEIIWQYLYDDIIKGTGTIWRDSRASCPETEYLILQGSRLGVDNSLASASIPSYRAISLKTGKAVWKYNIRRTESYSRDCDASALVVGDTVYIGLENGIFTVFHPGPDRGKVKDGLLQPTITKEFPLYSKADRARHGGNLVTESSPCLLNGHIYVSSGSGHVFGYDMENNLIDWDFYTGSDMDGSPVVTADNCLLVTVEKQYISGQGGVFKLDPSKAPEDAVCWYFPVKNKEFNNWEGGVIGSAGVSHMTHIAGYPEIAAFMGIDGYLYVVHQNLLANDKMVAGPDGKTLFPCPKLLFRYETGPSISTPVIVKNRLLAASYKGIYLFSFDKYMKFTLLDYKQAGCEATPFAHKGKVFIASRNGNLYCLGK